MNSNPGETITIYNLPSLVKFALPSAATPNNIQAGFESTGIWQFNREMFKYDDFRPSPLTDFPRSEVSSSTEDFV
jgi:hypothetical protein